MIVPFDWWNLTRTLMVEKGWTRRQVGELTLGDLRLLAWPAAPPEPGGGGLNAIRSADDFERALADQAREANSWPS